MLKRILYIGLSLAVAYVGSGALYAQQQPPDALSLKQTQKILDTIERKIVRAKADEDELSGAIKQVTSIRTRSKQCVAEMEAKLQRINQTLARLGELGEEQTQGAKSRRALEQDQQQSVRRLTDCQFLATRSDAVVDALTHLQQTQLKKRLLQKEDNIRALALENLRNPQQWWDFTKRLVAEGTGIESLKPARIALVSVLAVLSMGFGFWLQRALARYAARKPHDTFAAQLSQAALTSVAYYLPALILFGVLTLVLTLFFYRIRPLPFIALLVYGLGAYTWALLTVRTILHPRAPAKQITPLPDPLAHAMARRLSVLALLALVGFLFFMTLLSGSLPEPGYLFARGVYITILGINAAWLVWLVGRIPRLARSGRGVRLVLLALLLTIVGAEWLGYRNLSTYLLLGLAGTSGAIVLFWVVGTLFSESYSSLDEGRRTWQKRMRAQLGLKGGEPFPGLVWLRIVTGMVLWGVLGLALLRIWGLSDAGFAIIFEYLVDGFKIGNVAIVPSKVLYGLLLFAALLTATRWFKDKLEKRWIRRTRLDAGAREAMVTVTGYVGFIIAVLVGLSLAGVKFQNIAIIAGALSVGIGFGLQNIVNNFVSGIILLFERPIRTGDWIVVGDTQGWVKKIRVRSTEVQTFDRTDVIVPNSEFISNQVSNWTLRDPYGRVIIAVGVAYGSDTQLVKKLLLDVANAHEQVMSAGPFMHAPIVLFLGFGDSALQFELRCFIKNIANRLTVMSDLNFEIDRMFREHDIDIPFPQRDLHVRDWLGSKPSTKQEELVLPYANPGNSPFRKGGT